MTRDHSICVLEMTQNKNVGPINIAVERQKVVCGVSNNMILKVKFVFVRVFV